MTTSDDRALSLLHVLLQICRDSEAGYETAERNIPDAKLWREFEPFRKQRGKIVKELADRIRNLRGDPDLPPSGAAKLHRAWIELRSMADPDANQAVLAEVERGEAFAVEAYRQALKEHDVDAATRKMFEHHYELVQAAHDRVKQLLDRSSSANV
jgi:uncharacterized protein (TIGR02284 family)